MFNYLYKEPQFSFTLLVENAIIKATRSTKTAARNRQEKSDSRTSSQVTDLISRKYAAALLCVAVCVYIHSQLENKRDSVRERRERERVNRENMQSRYALRLIRIRVSFGLWFRLRVVGSPCEYARILTHTHTKRNLEHGQSSD